MIISVNDILFEGKKDIALGCAQASESTHFDIHWSKAENEIPGLKLKKARDFLSYAARDIEHANVVLDCGCGDGVHAEVLKELDEFKQGDKAYVFLDISKAALSATKKRAPENSYFILGDICKLPFKDSSCDVVFSFGSIAYTENPKMAFAELIRVAKPGGLIGVWFFTKNSTLSYYGMTFFRFIYRSLNKIGLGFVVIHILVFVWGFFPTESGLAIWNSSYGSVREVVEVNIRPRNLSFPCVDEVLSWLEREPVELEDGTHLGKGKVWLRKS